MKTPKRRLSELPFLKWYPYLAAGSPRWQSLSLAAKGLFHELYDLAARQTPRGVILSETLGHVIHLWRVPQNQYGTLLAQLTGRNLIIQNLDGSLVFPDWNRHQRDGSFRNRGTELAQDDFVPNACHKDVDVDVEEDKEKEEDKDFVVFWKAYPSKVGKKAAQKAWDKATDKPDLEAILAAVEAQKKSKRWKEGYIPNPATWLNQGRWSDELDETAPRRGGVNRDKEMAYGGRDRPLPRL